MLWNAAAVIVTGLAILIAVRQGVRYTLVNDLDHVLREDGNEILLYFEGGGPNDWQTLQEELNRKAVSHDFHDWFVQFFDAQGQPTWSSVGAPQVPFPSESQRRQPAFSYGPFRLSYRPIPQGVKDAAAVVVGCSEAFIAFDLARIDRLVAMVAACVLLAAPLVGYVLTRRVIKPLAHMTQTTARLQPAQLDARLPIRGAGDELDSLAQTINGMLDRIGHYLEREHDFVASAAHELRTPLAAIRSNVEVALAMDRSRQEYRELLELVIEECSSLEALVNQLLVLAETDSEQLKSQRAPVALDQLATQAVAMFEGVADEHGVSLVLERADEAVVLGNPHRLRQVLSNLLDNAVKFTALRSEAAERETKPRGMIEVLVQRDDQRQQARLEIRDNGIGVPSTDLPHVFERFYRVDRSRRRDALGGGTGLGLSICKAIVEAHGGTIAIASLAGEGTVVEVLLPLYQTAPLPAEAAAS